MPKEIGGVLYLTEEESCAFLRNMIHPDVEAMRRRDRFFEQCDKLNIERHENCIIIDCPDIDAEQILNKLDT